MPPKATFFASSVEFRSWLAVNHDKVSELIIGFYKKHTKKATITYKEALDEALCFGWIDGIKKTLDENSYTFRFSPRKPKSFWSPINTKRANELIRLGRMQPPGLKAFQSRDPAKTEQYAADRAAGFKLDEVCEKKLKANRKAWEFFEAQPPSYQRNVRLWIMSAKTEETRLRRLATLIEKFANQRRLSS